MNVHGLVGIQSTFHIVVQFSKPNGCMIDLSVTHALGSIGHWICFGLITLFFFHLPLFFLLNSTGTRFGIQSRWDSQRCNQKPLCHMYASLSDCFFVLFPVLCVRKEGSKAKLKLPHSLCICDSFKIISW